MIRYNMKREFTYAAGQMRVRTKRVLALMSGPGLNASVQLNAVSSEMYSVGAKMRTAMMAVGAIDAAVPSLLISIAPLLGEGVED
jgi:predicted nicotinamide N-methyase